MSLRIVPLSYRQVCAYITEYHRHHKAPRGGKVFLGVRNLHTTQLVGVAVIARPSARAYAPEDVAEVIRTCTDGARNANSKLYGAARQICKAMGYKKVITYTEEGESGASLRAAGFVLEAILEPRGSWAESTQDPRLRAMRDSEGRGGVRRYRWAVTFTSAGAA